MKDRENTLLWIKDLIEHMSRCQEALHLAGDGQTVRFLTDAMMGDLGECRRLCEQLRKQPAEDLMALSH